MPLESQFFHIRPAGKSKAAGTNGKNIVKVQGFAFELKTGGRPEGIVMCVTVA
jgi:hypothetical protein